LASQIDWSHTRNADLAETIQKIQDTKKPKIARISPWPDEPEKPHKGEIPDCEKDLNRKLILGKEASETAPKGPDEHRVIDDLFVVDPRTGLSRPNDDTVFTNEFEYYDWYRSIEEKLPRALNDIDWKKIEKYEASAEWEYFYGRRGYARMVRIVSDLRQPCDQEDQK
jgi:hypothetical protein